MPEKLLALFMDKGKQVNSNQLQIWYQNWNPRQREQPRTNGDQVCNQCEQYASYCIWLPEGVCQKLCDWCAVQKIICTISMVWVSKWKCWEPVEKRRPWKKSQVKEESEVESEGSGTRGLRQEASSALVEIRELLREQNGYLKRTAQSLDGGLGASEYEDDSTMRE